MFESPDLKREFEIKTGARDAPAEEPVTNWIWIAIFGAVGSALVLVGGTVAFYLIRRKRTVGDEAEEGDEVEDEPED